jgi:hypothetical protein
LPVTATKRKDVAMIRFRAPEKLENRHTQFDIVCYLRLLPTGTLEINYSHHVISSRDSTVGPFHNESKARMTLDAPLRSLIAVGVMQEFWSCVNPTFRTVPGDLGDSITELDF